MSPVSIRPSAEELAEWRDWASRRKLSLSNLVRATMAEALALERAVARADEEADRRAERIGRMDPVAVREGSRFAGWGPELEDDWSGPEYEDAT